MIGKYKIMIKAFGLIVISLYLLTGCASKNSKELINTYAQSTKDVTTKTQVLLKDVNETRLNAKALTLLTKGSAISVNELKFKEIKSLGINKTLTYLNDFSTSLIILSDDSSNKSLSIAMNKLNGSLSNLNETTKSEIKDKELSILSTLVFSLGSFYLDSKKYDKLKEIIIASEKNVTLKLNGLSEGILEFKKTYIRALKEERRRLLKLANFPHHYYINTKNEKTLNTYVLKSDEHKELYKELIILSKRIEIEPKKFDLISKTFKDISMLHKKIIISLQEDDDLSFSKIKRDSYDIKNKLKAIKEFKKGIK